MRMHRSAKFGRVIAASALLVLVVSACGGGDDDDAPAPPVSVPVEVFTAGMTGDQEAPTKIVTTGTGAATLTLERATRTLSGNAVVAGFTPTVAHIHVGAVGVAGGIALQFTVNAVTGAITLPPTVLTPEQLRDLDQGNLYVNIHSSANPAGEVRGQINRTNGAAQVSGAQSSRARGLVPVRWAASRFGADALPNDMCTPQSTRPL
jgi:hypothetical protein